MDWIAHIASFLEIVLLLYVATIDIATRLIRNEICVALALLGIAGRDAFIRAPSGQTGLLREGDELGGVKLLQIGTNRVLIEHEGQKKELTVFSGFGSESLLLKGKETSP